MTPYPQTPTTVPEIRTLRGLYLQPNTFTVPDGALEEAENIVVRDDNTLGSRRGYYQYFSPSNGTYNNLFLYDATLMGLYTDKIAYYTQSGTYPNNIGAETILSGASFTISGVSNSQEANSNFYWTTNDGVMKITAYNSIVVPAGAPPGLDLVLTYTAGNSAVVLQAGNICAYSAVFGYVDANENVILGSPSMYAEIDNNQITGVSYTSTGGGPYTITVMSDNHGLSTGWIMDFSAGTSSNVDGIYEITVTSINEFTYNVSSNPTTGTLSYAFNMPVLVEATIPSIVSTSLPWFVQIYRTTQTALTNSPFNNYALATQIPLTSAMISAGVVFFSDDVPDILLTTPLYTNTNNGEGATQTNNPPPLCQDMCSFQNYSMYANVTSPQNLYINLINPSVLEAGNTVSFKIDSTTWTYVAASGVGNQTVLGVISSSGGNLTFTLEYAHGFSNGWTIYVSNPSAGQTSLAAGIYYVISSSTYSFGVSLTSGGTPIAWVENGWAYFEGITNGTHNIWYLSNSSDAGVALSQTAIYLVKAVNRDPTAKIYGLYTSINTDTVPGTMAFQSIGFTDPIYMAANSTTAGAAFFPALPGSFTVGTQAYSSDNNIPNGIYISKYGIPEAVPPANYLPAGNNNAPIYRIIALRDVVIIVKADGVFRMTGNSLENFTVTILDNTIFCVAPSSVALLNNQVIYLSNQGICLISESSVEIISRAKIEDEIQPILGQANLSSQTAGMGYETERLYIITTTEPNTTTATITWVYNILTNEWTSWDTLFAQATIGPNDTMYYIGLDNNLYIERKTQTAYDYSDQNYSVTITTLSSDGTIATITINGSNYFPQEGDMIVSNADVITWIASNPQLISGSTFSVTFTPNNDLAQGDTLILYEAFYQTILFSPFHAGLLSRMKLFSQFQMHMRNSSLTQCIITFSGYALGGSGQIIWNSQLVTQGWGNPPWGFFAWGQENTINLPIGTGPAGVVRTYIPPYQARTTFIQAGIQHLRAGEPLEIQAISYVVRPYSERTTN